MQLQWPVLALFVAWMVVDHRVVWPSFLRRHAVDPARARRTLWAQWIASLWALSALALGAWIADGRPLAGLGLALPAGWRLWGPALPIVAIVALQLNAAARIARMTRDKTRLREQIGSTGLVMPRDDAEMPAWLAASVTAGFCEELLFRGFLVAVLQPLTGPWIAAGAAVLAFASAHAYQGRDGLVRTAVLGAAFMALFLVTRSLWPGIVLHAALDLVGGWIGMLILREPASTQAQGSR